ncbi:helix-hairpin-helix domain-containing protein [Streptomyces sp. NPDC051555]|uniref:helix-hairpin-helix domain-containing protein n=1 Tax=Streptomyces sp. NPDC051555 TaxID=3365657 RepID=UPI0037A10DDC
MTLRTRTSPSSGATSGPGRSYASDGRTRRRVGRRTPVPPSPALRRRAEALLDSGAAREAPPDVPQGVPRGGPRDGPPGTTAVSGAVPAPVGSGWALAVRERMPVWVQTRCGWEPKTLGAVAVVLVVAVGFAGQQYWSARPQPVTAPAVSAPPLAPAGAVSVPFAASTGPARAPAPAVPFVVPPFTSATGPSAGARIVVDVSGKVREPGVRRLPAGSRVEDALAAAGGVQPGTDTSGLNRARILLDGEQVLVGVPAQPAPGGPAPGGPGQGPGPVSLATATVEQLDGLPGVGPVLARHIVDYRTARGGFRSVEELRQVNGIGDRRFADLRVLVRP